MGLSGNDGDKKAKFQPRRVCPKTDRIIEKQNILTKSQSQNALYLSGYFYFVIFLFYSVGTEIQYFPTAPIS